MSEYTQYVNAVNRIFELLNFMKEKWDFPDNLAYIEKIEEYKDEVIEASTQLSKKKTGIIEELGQ